MTWNIWVEIPPKTPKSHDSHSVVTAGAFHSSLGNHPLWVWNIMEQCQIGPTWTNILLMNIPSKYCMFTKRPSWHEGFHHSVLFIDTGKQSVGFVGQLQKSHTFHRWRDSLGHRPKLKTRFSSDYLYYRFHMVPCLKFKDGSSMSAYISTQCKREREGGRRE